MTVPVTLPPDASNMNPSQLSLTLTLSILTLSSWYTAAGLALALEGTRYKHQRAYHRLGFWQSFLGAQTLPSFFLSFNLVCFIVSWGKLTHLDVSFHEAERPSCLELALVYLSGHVTFMKHSMSLVACLLLNSFEAILELSLMKISLHRNFHQVPVTRAALMFILLASLYARPCWILGAHRWDKSQDSWYTFFIQRNMIEYLLFRELCWPLYLLWLHLMPRWGCDNDDGSRFQKPKCAWKIKEEWNKNGRLLNDDC